MIVWALVVWGVTSVLTQSRVLRGFRERFEPGSLAGDFVRCPQCVGWWVGLGASLALHLGVAEAAVGIPGPVRRLVVVLCDAFATSAAAALASKLEDALKGIASLMIRRD